MNDKSLFRGAGRMGLVTTCTLMGLAGCVSYQPLPLPGDSALAADLSALHLTVDPSLGGNPGAHEINLEDGLDLTEIGIIAVLNSPQLKMQRTRLQVAGAQVFAAGLLPDPQISASLDQPTGKSAGLVNAGTLGLTYDIIPLIDRQARMDAERQGHHQVRLDLLWQEWQVIAEARSLAVGLILQERQRTLLHQILKSYQSRYERSSQALADGDITLDINGTDLTALVDVLSQINQLEQALNDTRHRFNLVLGLGPYAQIDLAPLPLEQPLDDQVIAARLDVLPQVRPDLLALQAGYDSQESRLRAAILAQFPSLGVGVNLGRDTGNIKTAGVSISLNLPLFSGNRGPIAVARATREQLREEYQNRLAVVYADVDRLMKLQGIIQRQLGELQTYLPMLERVAQRAQGAYQQGDMDALTFLNMESTWINKRLEQVSLQRSSWENRIALETLLALPAYADLTLPAPIDGEDEKP